MTLKAKHADFQQIIRSDTSRTGLSVGAEIERVVVKLLEPLFPTTKGIRLIRGTVSAFDNDTAGERIEHQLSLL